MGRLLPMSLLLFTVAVYSTKADAAVIWADSLVDSEFVTSFGSGDVTGPPDGGGLFLGDDFDPPDNPGMITVEFFTPLGDGPGDDLEIVDVVSSANETADISVSSDNISFTLIGGINAVNNTIDIGGLFTDPVRFVKVANSSEAVSIDVDAVGGNFEFEFGEVPAPGGLALVSLGLMGLVLRRRRS